jgi:hypothetical protein
MDGERISDHELEQRAKSFSIRKVAKADPADRNAWKNYSMAFPSVLTSKDWERELGNAKARLVNARNRGQKTSEGK